MTAPVSESVCRLAAGEKSANKHESASTTETSEILALSDRIAVMSKEEVVRILDSKNTSADEILSLALGRNDSTWPEFSQESAAADEPAILHEWPSIP